MSLGSISSSASSSLLLMFCWTRIIVSDKALPVGAAAWILRGNCSVCYFYAQLIHCPIGLITTLIVCEVGPDALFSSINPEDLTGLWSWAVELWEDWIAEESQCLSGLLQMLIAAVLTLSQLIHSQLKTSSFNRDHT